MRKLSILVLCVAICLSTAGVFEFQEIRDISYDAKIGDNRFWFLPEFDISKVNNYNIDLYEKQLIDAFSKNSERKNVVVTDSTGKKLICILPEILAKKEKEDENVSRNPEYFSSIIGASFYVNKCINSISNGWWKYRLCRGQMIQQIHGASNDADYVVNMLGFFDSKYSMPHFSNSTADRLLYVEESYSGGDLCDLKNHKDPRKTIVRYQCDRNLETNEAYIESIDENRPCEYILVVKVGSLCAFPEFLPPKQRNTHKIECHPKIEKEQIRSILEAQIANSVNADRIETLRKNLLSSASRYMAMHLSKLKYLEKENHILEAYVDVNRDFYDYFVTLAKVDKVDISPEIDRELRETIDDFVLVDMPIRHLQLFASLNDTNKAFLWYYFNDPNWPWKHFPRDLFYVVIANTYFEEMKFQFKNRPRLKFRNNRKITPVGALLKYGINDLDNNVELTYRSVIPMAYLSLNLLLNPDDHPVARFLWDHVLMKKIGMDADLAEDEEFEQLLDHYIFRTYYDENSLQLPMNNISIRALEILFDAIPKNLDAIAKKGRREKKFGFLEVYEELAITKITTESKYNYKLKLQKTPQVIAKIQDVYQRKLLPIYNQINYFYYYVLYENKVLNPVPPPTEDRSEDYEVHEKIAKDYLEFVDLLTEATIWRIEKSLVKFEDATRYNPRESTVEQFLKGWPKNKRMQYSKRAVNDTIFEIIDGKGRLFFEKLKKMVWESTKRDYLEESQLMENEGERINLMNAGGKIYLDFHRNLVKEEFGERLLVDKNRVFDATSIWYYYVMAIINPKEETEMDKIVADKKLQLRNLLDSLMADGKKIGETEFYYEFV